MENEKVTDIKEKCNLKSNNREILFANKYNNYIHRLNIFFVTLNRSLNLGSDLEIIKIFCSFGSNIGMTTMLCKCI